MRLIDWVKRTPRRLCVPLAGYPGCQLTASTVKQNEFNAELQARSLYKLVEQTGMDAVFTMMDLSVEAGSLGLPVRFPLEDSATVEWHPVKHAGDLNQYKVIDPLYDGRVWVYIETIRLLKKRLTVPVGAYVIGPFTLAGLMMGANDIAMATIESPDVVQATVNFAERVVISYARALEEAGADMIAILDPTCVILSPQAYREFCAPAVENLIRHLAAPTIMHICGNTHHLIGPMCETGCQGLSLDSMVDFPAVAKIIPPDVALIGNINPTTTMLRGTPQEVHRETLDLLQAMEGYDNFIMSTGCDLPANAPVQNIRAMMQTVQEYPYTPGKKKG